MKTNWRTNEKLMVKPKPKAVFTILISYLCELASKLLSVETNSFYIFFLFNNFRINCCTHNHIQLLNCLNKQENKSNQCLQDSLWGNDTGGLKYFLLLTPMGTLALWVKLNVALNQDHTFLAQQKFKRQAIKAKRRKTQRHTQKGG